jgi:hypothetical protein
VSEDDEFVPPDGELPEYRTGGGSRLWWVIGGAIAGAAIAALTAGCQPVIHVEEVQPTQNRCSCGEPDRPHQDQTRFRA